MGLGLILHPLYFSFLCPSLQSRMSYFYNHCTSMFHVFFMIKSLCAQLIVFDLSEQILFTNVYSHFQGMSELCTKMKTLFVVTHTLSLIIVFLFVRNCDATYIQHILFIPLIIYRSTDNAYICICISMKNIIATCTCISHHRPCVFVIQFCPRRE
jgi:hypothetical protein